MKTLLVFKFIVLFTTSSIAEEVFIVVDNHKLTGTLSPAEKGKNLAVLLIAGSGPTDRDGNIVGASGKNNCLKYLSDALVSKNITTLRCDKRGVSGSLGNGVKEEDLRFDTYIGDAVSWIQFLHNQGYQNVVLLGHSEGALVATLAAQKSKVSGLITVAGAGRRIQEVLREQLKSQLPEKDYTKANQIILALSKGKQVPLTIPSLRSVFRPSVQPYLISCFKFDPALELSRVKVPVLIIQGSTDIQTSVKDAQKLHAEAKDSQLKIIEGMNHIMKQQAGNLRTQIPSYTDPKLPLHNKLLDTILLFLNGLKS